MTDLGGTRQQEPARVYDELFVSAIFGAWAPRVADAAALQPGQRVLDVACGTGVLTMEVAGRVGAASVTGFDLLDGMLAVAKEKSSAVTWRQGDAHALPFDNESFDRVVCQFGMMFFQDRSRAVREMVRVLRPSGRLTLSVFDHVDQSPGYVDFIGILDRTLGPSAGDVLRAPFALGDPSDLIQLVEEAGAGPARVTTHGGMARFRSIREWVTADVMGWVAMFQPVADDDLARVLAAAEVALARYVAADGSVAFSLPAHILTASKS